MSTQPKTVYVALASDNRSTVYGVAPAEEGQDSQIAAVANCFLFLNHDWVEERWMQNKGPIDVFLYHATSDWELLSNGIAATKLQPLADLKIPAVVARNYHQAYLAVDNAVMKHKIADEEF